MTLDLHNLSKTGSAPANNNGERKRSVNRLAASFAAKNGNNNGKSVENAAKARQVARQWLAENLDEIGITFGLPEVDDRYEAWRVSLLNQAGEAVGEVMIRCSDSEIIQATKPSLIENRLLRNKEEQNAGLTKVTEFTETRIGNSSVVCGDARVVLRQLPEKFFTLVVTSPPYYNARPQYSEYSNYSEYLALLKDVFTQCHRTLEEGRFLIVNASPVLIRRPSRNKSSKRIPVPFHINSILESIGFEFIDDIIWVKPTGAGWNTGRGRRFAADRHPLQYKPVPITEYFLVYRKATDKLIDWNIRVNGDQEAVKASKIDDGYEITNVWYSKPSHHPVHPAVFPVDIIRKLVSYYSFKGDIVLDPFAGIGTVGHAALRADRRFFLVDVNPNYCAVAIQELQRKCQMRLHPSA